MNGARQLSSQCQCLFTHSLSDSLLNVLYRIEVSSSAYWLRIWNCLLAYAEIDLLLVRVRVCVLCVWCVLCVCACVCLLCACVSCVVCVVCAYVCACVCVCVFCAFCMCVYVCDAAKHSSQDNECDILLDVCNDGTDIGVHELGCCEVAIPGV